MPEQKVVDADYLLLEAPRERKFITGAQAMAEAVKRANVDIAIAYPITPQSEVMHLVGDIWAQGYLKDYYRAEEEYGAMSAIAGAVRGGARAFSATSGPGLLRGLEAIVSWPGHRIPAVLGVLTRVVNAPLSIQPDNVEIAYLLHSGVVVLHAENQQDVFDFTLASFVISEMVDVYIPIAVCTEGFFVTHAKGYVNMTPEDMKLPPRDPYKAPVPPTSWGHTAFLTSSVSVHLVIHHYGSEFLSSKPGVHGHTKAYIYKSTISSYNHHVLNLIWESDAQSSL